MSVLLLIFIGLIALLWLRRLRFEATRMKRDASEANG